ncbi:MAG: hypothetical protein GXO02_04645 [Epsilonproteobacteria bacterium]|nr:hypothetical protein [Campylobacterota bacterium]
MIFLFTFSFLEARYIGTYYARLGVWDHFNSRGERLTDAAAIIRQDRFNYHIRGIDLEDTWDPFSYIKEIGLFWREC